MADIAQVAESVGRRYEVLRPHLDERQRRLLLGTEASVLGRGGVKAVAEATGARPCPDAVARGKREVEGGSEPTQQVRGPGGGRKKLAESDPGLAAKLMALVDPGTRGDPMSLLVWTTKSTRNLAGALTSMGPSGLGPDSGPDAALTRLQPAGQHGSSDLTGQLGSRALT